MITLMVRSKVNAVYVAVAKNGVPTSPTVALQPGGGPGD
jgi:hypothetical protein